MITIKAAVTMAALAFTTATYGDDGSVAVSSVDRDTQRIVAVCQALDPRVSTGAVQSEEKDSTKPTPMFGYCVDGDGGDNPSVASYLLDAYGTQWQDQCYSSTKLIEMTCGFAGQKIDSIHNCTCVSEWIYVPGYGNRYAGRCQ